MRTESNSAVSFGLDPYKSYVMIQVAALAELLVEI